MSSIVIPGNFNNIPQIGPANSAWGPQFNFTPPIDGDFTWTNQGSATITNQGNSLLLTQPAGTPNSLAIRKKATLTPPYTVDVAFIYPTLAVNFFNAGMIWRESGSGKIVSIGVGNDATIGTNIVQANWNSPTSFNAAVAQNSFTTNGIFFLRAEDDGANRIFSFSGDGENWIVYVTVARTSFITPDQIGFFADVHSTYTSLFNLLSWKESS